MTRIDEIPEMLDSAAGIIDSETPGSFRGGRPGFSRKLREAARQMRDRYPRLDLQQSEVAGGCLMSYLNATGQVGSPAMPGEQQTEGGAEMVAALMRYLRTKDDSFNPDGFLRDASNQFKEIEQ